MRPLLDCVCALALGVLTTHAQAASCGARIGSAPVSIDGAVAFQTQALQVDADGAPNSYLVDGNGLSRTCDGIEGIVNGRPVPPGQPNWQKICNAAWANAQSTGDFSKVKIFGFFADPKTNVPAIQKEGDPLPGKGFVSTTSMSVAGFPADTQRHWVDATKIPYFVLPASTARRFGIKFGDVALIYLPKSGKQAFAVFADAGPALGEASVKLHFDLGQNPISKHGSVERADIGFGGTVVTLAFPGKTTQGTTDAEAWNRQIASLGASAFDAWGGIDKLKGCLRWGWEPDEKPENLWDLRSEARPCAARIA